MNLKTRVAEFDISILKMQTKFVQTFDMNEPLISVKRGQNPVQLRVARTRREVFLDQIRRLYGRQNPAQNRVRTEIFRPIFDDFYNLVDFRFQSAQTIAQKIERR